MLLQPRSAAPISLIYRSVLAQLVTQVIDDHRAGRHANRDAASIIISLIDIQFIAPYLQRYV